MYISKCSTQQLGCLKAAKILPVSAPSCGLITLTDAERLCGALLHRKSHPARQGDLGRRWFPVEHRCFGHIQGRAYPDLFIGPDAACIECDECRGVFSPQHFVLHSHRSMEQGLCHWGFDSARWRKYVFIPDDGEQELVAKFQGMLDELNNKFQHTVNLPGKAALSVSEMLSRHEFFFVRSLH